MYGIQAGWRHHSPCQPGHLSPEHNFLRLDGGMPVSRPPWHPGVLSCLQGWKEEWDGQQGVYKPKPLED